MFESPTCVLGWRGDSGPHARSLRLPRVGLDALDVTNALGCHESIPCIVAGPFLTPLVGEPILGVEFLAFGAAYIGSSPYFEFATSPLEFRT